MDEMPSSHNIDGSRLLFDGYFLDSSQRNHLLTVIPPVFENVDCDHITAHFWGNSTQPPPVEELPVGDMLVVAVLGVAVDFERKVQAAIIDVDIPGKPYPHITISTGTNEDGSRVPPVLSNDAIGDAIRDGTVFPVPSDLSLRLTSGYYLGQYGGGVAIIRRSQNLTSN